MYNVLYFRVTYYIKFQELAIQKKIFYIISKYKIIFNFHDFDKLLITIRKSYAVLILIIAKTFNQLKMTSNLNVLKVTFIIEK